MHCSWNILENKHTLLLDYKTHFRQHFTGKSYCTPENMVYETATLRSTLYHSALWSVKFEVTI